MPETSRRLDTHFQWCNMEPFAARAVVLWRHRSAQAADQALVAEEPLAIRIQGQPYAVVMRTPGEEKAHAAGFCLTEGLVDTWDDVAAIGFCDENGTNVVTVTLSDRRREAVGGLLERRGYISQTSCGLCGKQLIEELFQLIRPVRDESRIKPSKARALLEDLGRLQPLRAKTAATHSATLYDRRLQPLVSAEDVGRHNALDKAIGKLFVEARLHEASVLALSSRISYELVQKAARARIPIILAISRPTTLAVSLATELDITLACLAREGGLFIYCGKQRLGF